MRVTRSAALLLDGLRPRSCTAPERVRFVPYIFNGSTMRWQNRPTYQQVLSFGG